MITHDLVLKNPGRIYSKPLCGVDTVRKWGNDLRYMIAENGGTNIHSFISQTGLLSRVSPSQLHDEHMPTWLKTCNEMICQGGHLWLKAAWADVAPSSLIGQILSLADQFDREIVEGDRAHLYTRILNFWKALDSAELVLAKAKKLQYREAEKWDARLAQVKRHLLANSFLVVPVDVNEYIASVAQTAQNQFADDDPLSTTLEKYVWALRVFEKAHHLE